MEKSNYNIKLLQLALREYNNIIELNNEDYEYIYLLFSYPEKFWKLSNFYYNTKKTFISPKNMEKLQLIIAQDQIREEFLSSYLDIYT